MGKKEQKSYTFF